jgi:hypothetical protein
MKIIGQRYMAAGVVKDNVRKGRENIFITCNFTPLRISLFNFIRLIINSYQCKHFMTNLKNEINNFRGSQVVYLKIRPHVFIKSVAQSFKSFSFNSRNIDIWTLVKSDYLELSILNHVTIRKPIKCLRVLFQYYSTYALAKEFFNKIGNDNTAAIIWNGRFASCEAFRKVCEINNVKTLFIETGSHMNKYELFENSLHSVQEWHKKVSYNWSYSNIDVYKRQIMADDYFKVLRDNPKRNIYLRNQDNFDEPNKITSVISDGKPVLVYYTTSIQEFASLMDPEPDYYFKDQFTAFRALMEVEYFKDWNVFIRIHPQLKDSIRIKNLNDKPWLTIAKQFRNVSVISSTSRINSYRLAERASLVVGFETNFTIESIYWGVPTLILGPTICSYLTPKKVARSIQELTTIQLDELSKNDSSKLIPYAYHQTVRGRLIEGELFTSEIFRGKLLIRLSSLKRKFQTRAKDDYDDVRYISST